MTEKKEYRLAEKVLSGYVKNVSEAQKLYVLHKRIYSKWGYKVSALVKEYILCEA